MGRKEKLMMFLAFVAMIAMIAVSYTTAWADGAREPADLELHCEKPPLPTNQSPVIHGTFTASYFPEDSQSSKYYSIQTVLEATKVITDKKKMEELKISSAGCTKMKTDKKESGNMETCPPFESSEIDLTRLHTFAKCIVIDKELCNYTENDLMSLYWARPCNVQIQKEFGLKGHAVLTDIKITNTNHCDDKKKAAISGTFKIRVVP